MQRYNIPRPMSRKYGGHPGGQWRDSTAKPPSPPCCSCLLARFSPTVPSVSACPFSYFHLSFPRRRLSAAPATPKNESGTPTMSECRFRLAKPPISLFRRACPSPTFVFKEVMKRMGRHIFSYTKAIHALASHIPIRMPSAHRMYSLQENYENRNLQ